MDIKTVEGLPVSKRQKKEPSFTVMALFGGECVYYES